MKCYETRPGKHFIGGHFITGDGKSRMIPDRWLHNATLENDGNELKLYYSSCTVEISGFRLTKIFEDTVEGRLGKVTIADPPDDMEAAESTEEPFVTNITHISMRPEAATSDLDQNK